MTDGSVERVGLLPGFGLLAFFGCGCAEGACGCAVPPELAYGKLQVQEIPPVRRAVCCVWVVGALSVAHGAECDAHVRRGAAEHQEGQPVRQGGQVSGVLWRTQIMRCLESVASARMRARHGCSRYGMLVTLCRRARARRRAQCCALSRDCVILRPERARQLQRTPGQRPALPGGLLPLILICGGSGRASEASGGMQHEQRHAGSNMRHAS
jgi:hypothetical protein